MRYALAFIALLSTGCVSQSNFQPPAGHPASAQTADASPLHAADPFAVEARPIQPSANPHEGMDHSGHEMNQDDPGEANTASEYPMDTCPVTGAELGTMGKPIDVMLGDRMIRVCCPACVKTVKDNPERYLKMLDEAAAKQRGSHGGHGGHGADSEGGH